MVIVWWDYERERGKMEGNEGYNIERDRWHGWRWVAWMEMGGMDGDGWHGWRWVAWMEVGGVNWKLQISAILVI